MSKYLLAIDQGTTSSRAMLFDRQGQFVAVAQQEFKQSFPEEGWVEHDPEEIWQSVLTTVREVLERKSAKASDIIGIGITNQRETTVVWDKASGKPVYPAIVWQDRRTAAYCAALNRKPFGNVSAAQGLHDKTGLVVDPYFSATKIHWILEHVPQAQQLSANDQLAAGTIDTWLIWNLTNGRRHVTDATNASRTQLFNIHEQQWDKDLCDFFQVPQSMLPEVLDCAADFGICDASHFGAEIPIAGVAGDQHAALIGQACFKKGMSKCTFGTGCFLVVNTGDAPVVSQHGLLTTMGYRLQGKPTYAMEGSAFIAGAVVQWLRDGLGFFSKASESEAMAQHAKSSQVSFVPAFTGLGAPYWDPNARGAILGLSRDTGPNEIVAAALEAVCLQTLDLLKAMTADGTDLTGLRVDGGFTANNYAMQLLANLTQQAVVRPAFIETTALGAAYLAGLQLGVFDSLETISKLWQKDRTIEVKASSSWAAQRYTRWQAAVAACQSFAAASV